jgi:hypothetical protein
MKSYIDARRILEKLEEKWFTTLKGRFSGSPPPPLPVLSNGEAQFFSIEDFNPNRSPKAKIPPIEEEARDPDKNGKRLLIVAVGINYGQSPTTTPPSSLVSHLLKKNGPASWVVDNGSPATRNALDEALRQFDGNAQTWWNNSYASPTVKPAELCLGGQPRPYILVCTNLSPFLSQLTWGRHSPAHQQAALAGSVWNPNHHLCDLIGELGADVDLWVVHGIKHVWPTFDKASRCISNWLMTPNLSRLGLLSMKTFWNRPPIWPRCETTKADLIDLPAFDE